MLGSVISKIVLSNTTVDPVNLQLKPTSIIKRIGSSDNRDVKNKINKFRWMPKLVNVRQER